MSCFDYEPNSIEDLAKWSKEPKRKKIRKALKDELEFCKINEVIKKSYKKKYE
jgi:DNA-binding transcriptional ArsR family regulator